MELLKQKVSRRSGVDQRTPVPLQLPDHARGVRLVTSFNVFAQAASILAKLLLY